MYLNWPTPSYTKVWLSLENVERFVLFDLETSFNLCVTYCSINKTKDTGEAKIYLVAIVDQSQHAVQSK